MSKYTKLLLIVLILGVIGGVVAMQRAKSDKNFAISQVSPTPVTQVKENLSFIESLRSRDYNPSQINIESTLSNNGAYTGYLISYLSDELKIYGRMNVPVGDPPSGGFPVIVLNHGYFNSSTFNSGDGTQNMAEILARNGYLTLASDYRGFGKSENDGQGSSGHRPEYAIDVLNLIASVETIDKADPNNIGMWGHSMGGEVALRSVEATDSVKALTLWAPTSGRVSDNSRFYGGGRSRSANNPNEDGASPINYLRYISTPISLHQGLVDSEVNPEWAKELNEALQNENKAVEYFEYPGQDHNFRNLGWDIISKRTIDFFDKYLK
jgi:dipeptidyl aminopeptidase/acylaminoacyl peptidase